MGGKPFGTIPTDKENDMKMFFIGLFVAIGIFDVLLVMGCAKLERMREENERSDSEADK